MANLRKKLSGESCTEPAFGQRTKIVVVATLLLVTSLDLFSSTLIGREKQVKGVFLTCNSLTA